MESNASIISKSNEQIEENNNLNGNDILTINDNFIQNNLNPLKQNLNQAKINEIFRDEPEKIPSYRKSMWTNVEDQLLCEAVKEFGTSNWGLVAACISGRTRKQCRERWTGKINPEIVKDPWTEDEDNKLMRLHNQLGNKWASISSQIPGRSPIMLRNRFQFLMRHSKKSKNKSMNLNSQQNDIPNDNIQRTEANSNTDKTNSNPSFVLNQNQTQK